MILTPEYFRNPEVFIPQYIPEPSAGFNTPNIVGSLQARTDYREKQVLVFALGLGQYDQLAGFFTNGQLQPDAPQKWKDLVGGSGNWQGLIYEVSGQKYSLLAYYVYYFWLWEQYRVKTGVGVAIPDAANAWIQPPTAEMCNAWNAFMTMYGGGYCGCDDLFYTDCCQPKTFTLFDFLSSRPDDYSVLSFRRLGFADANVWGI